MLTKKSDGVANGPRLKKALAGVVGGAMDRRMFLKRSGLTAGGAALAAATSLLPAPVRKYPDPGSWHVVASLHAWQ